MECGELCVEYMIIACHDAPEKCMLNNWVHLLVPRLIKEYHSKHVSGLG